MRKVRKVATGTGAECPKVAPVCRPFRNSPEAPASTESPASTRLIGLNGHFPTIFVFLSSGLRRIWCGSIGRAANASYGCSAAIPRGRKQGTYRSWATCRAMPSDADAPHKHFPNRTQGEPVNEKTMADHLQVDRYGDFWLTDAIRPAQSLPVVPRRATGSTPTATPRRTSGPRPGGGDLARTAVRQSSSTCSIRSAKSSMSSSKRATTAPATSTRTSSAKGWTCRS